MRRRVLVIIGLHAFWGSTSLGAPQRVLWEAAGDGFGDDLGWSVQGAGDIDGDGTADVIAGAPGGDGVFPGEGFARLYSGDDGSILLTLRGEGTADNFGWAVAPAGDVDGDGCADVVVGADADYVRVHSGRDGEVLFAYRVENRAWDFGNAVAGGGDLNRDGVVDVLVGAWGDDRPAADTGRVTAFDGSDGTVLWERTGAAENDRYGWSVAFAGDVDLDGSADALVAVTPESGSGFVDLLSGTDGNVLLRVDNGTISLSAVHSAGDVDRDGTLDFIAGSRSDRTNGTGAGAAFVFSGVDGTRLFEFFGEDSFHHLGASVSGGLDVNGDGFPDLLAGAPEQDRADVELGTAIAYSGRTGARMYTYFGAEDLGNWGRSCDLLPDVDGDGLADMCAGADREAENGVIRVRAGNDLFTQTRTPVAREGSPVVLDVLGGPPGGSYIIILIRVDGQQAFTPLTSGTLDSTGSARWTTTAPVNGEGTFVVKSFACRDPSSHRGVLDSNRERVVIVP